MQGLIGHSVQYVEKNVYFLILLIFSFSQAHASLVGSTSGEFSVSPSGAANYSIPIQVPPGIAGIQPALLLQYDSQGGNDLLGFGWSLSGLSTITRCPTTLEQDGFIDGIDFDGNDKFCLDGQRLVAVNGLYGAHGTEYRTEIDSFSRIISYGAQGSGPSHFKAWTKAGQIIEYGYSTDSRIEAQGRVDVLDWAVNKVSDRSGNYLSINYTEDTINGDYYVNRIDYSGNNSQLPENSVQFVYENRPDITTQYLAGSLIRNTKRLANIKTYTGTILVKDYQAVYENAGATNESRIVNITECHSSSNCLPPISFRWEDSGSNNFGTMTMWSASFPDSAGWNHPQYYSTITYPDVNGDGLPDICARGGTGIVCGINNGTSFGTMTMWSASFPDSAGWNHPQYYSTITYPDVNGDGLPDICARGIAGVVCGANNRNVGHIVSLTNSFDVETLISHKPLTEQSVYIKGSNASYPELDIQTPFYVVSKVTSDNGIGGNLSSSYHYEGMKVHQRGRGNLGFAKMTVTDNQTGIKTITTYRQDFPFIGSPLRNETRLANNQLLSETDTVYAYTGTINSTPVFPYISQRSQKAYDYNSGLLLTTVSATNAYDSFGNTTSATAITTGSSQTFSQQTLNTYSNDTSSWLIGRLTRTEVTSTIADGSSTTRVSAFEYDSNTGLTIKETIEPDSADPNLKFTTAFTYDQFGNRITQALCDGSIGNCNSSANGARVSSTSFSSNSASYPDGLFASSATNALGQSEIRTYDPKYGNTISLTGPNGITTIWQYDSLGRKTSELRADGTQTTISYAWCDSSCPAIGGATPKYTMTTQSTGVPAATIYYDKLSRELRRQSIGFDGTAIYVDTHYDNRGRVKKTSEPYYADGSSGATLWSTPTYDDIDRQLSLTYPRGDGSTLQSSTNYQGFITLATDAKGRVRSEIKNAIGQITQATDADGNSVYYRYDPLGNLTETEDSDGNIITMTYDVRSRRAAMDDPDMGQWSYSYNTFGELVSQTDAKGQVTTMAYDVLGRMTQRIDDVNNTHQVNTWVYGNSVSAKNVGKPVSVTGPSGTSKTYGYDGLGRISSTTYNIDTDTFVTQQSYDSLGRPSVLTYPATTAHSSGFQIQRVYNTYGYLEKVQSTGPNPTVYWQANNHNARGQLITDTLGNGVTTNRLYNKAQGWLEGVQATNSVLGVVYDTSYQYDEIGNLTNRTDNRQGIDETFTYDVLDRLITSHLAGDASKSFAYDALGNITYKSDVGDYSYGDCNAGPHAVCQAGNEVYSYDANGNMTQGAGRSVIYTAYNKPYQFIRGGTIVSFVYGADKSRVLKVSANKRTRYIGLGPTGGTVFEQEYDSNTGVSRNIHFIYAYGEHPVAQHVSEGTNKQTEYLHRDHLGSLEAITDELGDIVTYKSHDAWGKRRNTNWTDNPLGNFEMTNSHLCFTGQETIPEIGLIHMNGRVYDPDLGRFLSADPHIQAPGNTQSYNRYTYVLNNPLSHTDPSGFFFKKVAEAFKKAVNKVASAVKSAVQSIAKGARQLGRAIRRYWKPIVALAAAYFTATLASSAYIAAAGAAPAGSVITVWNAAVAAQASIIAGAVSGAAFSAVSTALNGGNLRDVLKAGVKGGVTGGLSRFANVRYADPNLSRVAANGIAGGVNSEINGGSFKDGFKLSVVVTGLEVAALRAREIGIRQSLRNPRNASGKSAGFRGDGFKLGGGREIEFIDGYLPAPNSPLGGPQGGKGRISFIFVDYNYKPGSFGDLLVEAYSGPHDYLNSGYWYLPSGNNRGEFTSGIANVFGQALNFANVAVATPAVAASVAQPYTSLYQTYRNR